MGVNYSDSIERMRWAGKLKNDSAVARTLGVTPQALSNYKKRGEMPTDLVLRFAGIYGLSVDWLITGEGPMYNPALKSGADQGQGAPRAAEETGTYGLPPKPPDFSALTPDEIIMIGKLLKILRGSNRGTSAAIKYSIDALLRASELPQEAEPKEAE